MDIIPYFLLSMEGLSEKKTATLHSQPMGPLDQHKDEIDVE